MDVISLLILVLSTLLISLLTWVLYTRLFHPLAAIPGPFRASVTRLWYVHGVRRGDFDKVNRELHKRYGPLVRIAPNEVSINDGEAVNTIYGIKSKFTKTDFYPVFTPDQFKTKHPDLFTDLDITHHGTRRKLLNNVYTMTSVLESERHIDETTTLFLDKLSTFASKNEDVDLGTWLEMYAFDTVGTLFFGSHFGFLRAGGDFDNWMHTLDSLLPLLVTIALLPNVLRPVYVLSSLIYPSIRQGLKDFGRVAEFAKAKVGEREEVLNNPESVEGKKLAGRRDLLGKLFELVQTKESEEFGIPDVQQEAYVSIVAGSDTTAIAMRSIVYQLLRHPIALARLRTELDNATSHISNPITYAESIKLPYITACVKEGMRLHPSVGLSAQRYVPAGGCELAGNFFPAGVRVGVNAAVVHYNEDAFGADAAEFRPERWLEKDAGGMDRYLLTFGGGARSCMGKNIALAEMHKVLPQLLRRFDIELVDPKRPLETKDWWFHKQEGLIVKLVARNV